MFTVMAAYGRLLCSLHQLGQPCKGILVVVLAAGASADGNAVEGLYLNGFGRLSGRSPYAAPAHAFINDNPVAAISVLFDWRRQYLFPFCFAVFRRKWAGIGGRESPDRAVWERFPHTAKWESGYG